MLESLFLPSFLKASGIVTGAGSGLIAFAVVGLAVLVAVYPITKRLK